MAINWRPQLHGMTSPPALSVRVIDNISVRTSSLEAEP